MNLKFIRTTVQLRTVVQTYFFQNRPQSRLSALKGVSSKPSGKYILGPDFCFLSQRPQILDTCLFFNFAELCKVSVRLDNIDIRHFTRVPPLNFCQIKKSKNILTKCLISMLSNLAETLHSSAKLKNKQVAKI